MSDNEQNIARPDRQDPTDAAAAWFLKLRNGEISEDIAEYQAWLASDPEHVKLIADVRSAWDMVGEHATAPEMITARSEALADGARAARSRWRRWNSWGAGSKAIAAMLAAVVIAAPITAAYLNDWFDLRPSAATQNYQTTIGKTRVLTLADNSRVSLDASSHLTVRYTTENRDLTLVQGQAHFDVAKDHLRPFRVRAGDRLVTATGTAFNVELIDDDVLVTLIEGEVVVTDDAPPVDSRRAERTATSFPGDRPPALHTLKPGQQLVASAGAGTIVNEAANLQKTTAWRSGKVILENDPLSIAVARVNRYSQIRIRVADRQLDEMTVSGVFDAGDTDGFLEALEAYFPIKARRPSSSTIELHAGS